MKIIQLFESQLSIKELSSESEFQDASEIINSGGQLSWTLTPSRLRGKLGGSGRLFALYSGESMVGTIGLKETTIEGIVGAEVGYLFIDPEYRSFSAYTLLYRAIKDVASSYNFIYATTITTNNTINKLMSRNQYVTFGFEKQSPFSSNMLNYWIAHGTKMDVLEVKEHFSDDTINESIENEFSIVFSNIEKAPSQFQNYIEALAHKSSHIKISDDVNDNEAELRFGRGNLPTE